MAGVEVVARTGNRDRAENDALKKVEGTLREARRKRVVDDIGEKSNRIAIERMRQAKRWELLEIERAGKQPERKQKL